MDRRLGREPCSLSQTRPCGHNDSSVIAVGSNHCNDTAGDVCLIKREAVRWQFLALGNRFREAFREELSSINTRGLALERNPAPFLVLQVLLVAYCLLPAFLTSGIRCRQPLRQVLRPIESTALTA